jgi:hypothetical protein
VSLGRFRRSLPCSKFFWRLLFDCCSALCLLLIIFLVEASARSPGSCSSNFYSAAQASSLVLDFAAWCTEKPPVFFGFAEVGQSWFFIVGEFMLVEARIILELSVQKTQFFSVYCVLVRFFLSHP